MADEPTTNPAAEGLHVTFERLNALAEPPDVAATITEDFSFEDHRSGGVNFGRLDASGWSKFMNSLWGLDSGQVHRSIIDVIAVRGERSAAVAVRIDYGSGNFNDFILCQRLDPSLSRVERIAHYDIDDADAALAELDRLHAEIDN